MNEENWLENCAMMSIWCQSRLYYTDVNIPFLFRSVPKHFSYIAMILAIWNAKILDEKNNELSWL